MKLIIHNRIVQHATQRGVRACDPVRSCVPIVVGIWCSAVRVEAAVLHVPGEFPTIRAAIEAATSGDEVRIAPGIYTGQGNRDLGVTKTLEIRGAGAGVTILDVQATPTDSHYAMVLHGDQGETMVLSDISVTGSNFSQGAVTLEGLGQHQVQRCAFRGNQSWEVGAGEGGGMTIEGGCRAVIDGCEFVGNTARQGAGVFCGGEAEAAFTNCVFSGNLAYGGCAIEVYPHAAVDVRDCWFAGNLGGDGTLDLYPGCTASVVRSVFLGAEASEAAIANSGTLLLREVTISGNMSWNNAAVTSWGTTQIENSVIWGNCSVSGGSAEIYVGDAGSCHITCSLINPAGLLGNAPTYHDGVVFDDPLFCVVGQCGPNGVDVADLRVQAGSACIPSNNSCVAWMGAVQEVCGVEPTGACCLGDGSCDLRRAADCAGANGLYQGDGVACADVDCGGGVPTQRATWGQIKARMR